MGDRMRRPCGKFSDAQPSCSDSDRLAEAAALQETLISFQRDCEEWCPSPHCFVH